MFEKIVIGLSAFLTVLCGVALADNTPGFQYGGAHCGCYSNSDPSTNSCELCCRDAVINNLMPAGHLDDCLAFCAQAVFPCVPKNGHGA